MKKFNFITKHLISKIELLILEKQNFFNHSGFIYFDEPAKLKNNKLLNRVNRYNFYYQNEILPQSFYFLEAKELMSLFDKLKNNKFYIYKQIGEKDYKTRVKS